MSFIENLQIAHCANCRNTLWLLG